MAPTELLHPACSDLRSGPRRFGKTSNLALAAKKARISQLGPARSHCPSEEWPEELLKGREENWVEEVGGENQKKGGAASQKSGGGSSEPELLVGRQRLEVGVDLLVSDLFQGSRLPLRIPRAVDEH